MITIFHCYHVTTFHACQTMCQNLTSEFASIKISNGVYNVLHLYSRWVVSQNS